MIPSYFHRGLIICLLRMVAVFVLIIIQIPWLALVVFAVLILYYFIQVCRWNEDFRPILRLLQNSKQLSQPQYRT